MTSLIGFKLICVAGRADMAVSNPPASAGFLWKQRTSFPPNPKLTTGTRKAVRPSGSFVPSNDGEGAYRLWSEDESVEGTVAYCSAGGSWTGCGESGTGCMG